MTEAIVLLSGPGGGLDIIETANWLAPVCFLCLYAISFLCSTL
jgi:hypothetical protein